MMRRFALLCLLCGIALPCATSLVQADEVAFLERIYGPGDMSTIAGNGRLTVGLNARGRISSCRWPSPGYHDQLSYRTVSTELPDLGVEPGHGLQWGIRVGDEVFWPSSSRWWAIQDYESTMNTVMRTSARLRGTSVTIGQTVFVHPEKDLLVSRLTARGFDSAPEFYWFANFTPCTRQIRELPIADWALDSLNDFAAFALAEKKTIVHFRPKAPGATDWERAERLATGSPIRSEWMSFGDGVWIAYTSPERVEAQHCGSDAQPLATVVERFMGEGPLRSSATGACYSAMKIIPQKDRDTYVATIFTAFGSHFQEAEDLLAFATEEGYDRLLESARDSRVDWLSDATIPTAASIGSIQSILRCLLTLSTATDSRTGAIVRSPTSQPPLARDWARHGAWMTLALDMAGFRAMAERHSLFYIDTVRKTAQRGKPLGSLPASSYTNAVEASPHLLVDIEAVAWMLWSFHEHATFLDGEERTAYLSKVWNTVGLTAEFLAGWADDRRGTPLHSFDLEAFRDRQSRELLVAVRLGLDSALDIAAALDQKAPTEWTRRKRELDVLLLNLCLDKTLTWELEQALPFSLGDILQIDDPRLETSVQKRLDALPELTGYAAAKALCEVAMLWRNAPERLATLQDYVEPVLKSALTVPLATQPKRRVPAFPDALTSALCYVAAMTIYGAAL